MNLIVDENIAFANEAFSGFGKLELVDGRSITNSTVDDADILIVRSVTKVDRKLLAGSKVQFVGTATIGTDHIDIEYLKKEILDSQMQKAVMQIQLPNMFLLLC
ncbi:MAG: hypothetical protein M5T52_19410 [Ignavibacteriaceae bacterium]|nr:hypothetical protein [Ignavibacteriaceae bacterium]